MTEQKMNAFPRPGKQPVDLNAMHKKQPAKSKKIVDPFKQLVQKKAVGNRNTLDQIRTLKANNYDFFGDEPDDMSKFDEEEEGPEMDLSDADEDDESFEEEDDDDVSKSLSSGDDQSEDSYNDRRDNKKKTASPPVLTQLPPKRKFDKIEQQQQQQQQQQNGFGVKAPRNLPVFESSKKQKLNPSAADEERYNQAVKITKITIEELTRVDENLQKTIEGATAASRDLEAREKSEREAAALLVAKEESCREAIAALERARAASTLVLPSDVNAQQQVGDRMKETFVVLQEREAIIQEKEKAHAEQDQLARRRAEEQQAKDAEQNATARRLADQEHALSLRAVELNNAAKLQAEREKEIQAKKTEQNNVAKHQADQEKEIASLLKRVADEERVLAFKTTEYNTLVKKVAEDKNKLQVEEAKFNTNLIQFDKQRETLEALKIELEKKEKALSTHVVTAPTKPNLPQADLFLAEMIKSNQNMLSYEEMSSIVPEHLMKKLGHFAGKTPLKYYSVSNSQYTLVEVTCPAAGVDMPPIVVMRHVVYKQLSNTK